MFCSCRTATATPTLTVHRSLPRFSFSFWLPAGVLCDRHRTHIHWLERFHPNGSAPRPVVFCLRARTHSPEPNCQSCSRAQWSGWHVRQQTQAARGPSETSPCQRRWLLAMKAQERGPNSGSPGRPSLAGGMDIDCISAQSPWASSGPHSHSGTRTGILTRSQAVSAPVLLTHLPDWRAVGAVAGPA